MIVRACGARGLGLALAALLWVVSTASAVAQDALPPLTRPVNDFANVIDPASEARLDDLIRRLQSATGDTIVVATRDAIAPFADERELAVKWYENGGRGIGDKEKDAGVLFVLLPKDRAVWIEVGYGLEGAITDGFTGSVSRELMAPAFREGRYGDGLVAGVTAVAERVAKERNVSLGDLPAAPRGQRQRGTWHSPVAARAAVRVVPVVVEPWRWRRWSAPARLDVGARLERVGHRHDDRRHHRRIRWRRVRRWQLRRRRVWRLRRRHERWRRRRRALVRGRHTNQVACTSRQRVLWTRGQR